MDTAPTDDDRTLDTLRRRFLQDGDEASMAELVRRTRPRLLGAARRIGHSQDAEDSVQASYHALLQTGPAPIEGPVIAWLLTAVVRIAYRRKAASLRRDALARKLAPRNPEADPASILVAEDEASTLRRILARLPAIYRDTLVLHHLQGLSVTEVALLLDAPEPTIKARLRRGRALLRSRLPLSLRLALLAVPWPAPHSLIAGGTMKAQTLVIALIVLASAAGGGALYLSRPGSRTPAPSGGEPAPTPAPAPSSPHAKSSAEAVGPVPRSGEAPPPAPEPAPAASPPAEELAPPGPGSQPWSKAMPEWFRRTAEAKGIPREAMDAAWTAYAAGGRSGGNVPVHLLDELKRHGADGFRAVVLLLRGNLNGTWFPDLAASCWSPGLEKELIDIADDARVHVHSRWSALQSLGRADTPASRDYLVDRLPRETDPGLLYSTANALAALHEPRAAEACAARISDKVLGDPVRTALMFDLVEMDAAIAKTVLVDLVRDEGVDLMVEAFHALAKADAAVAKAEAQAFLDRAPAGSLDASLEWRLRDLAGRAHEPDGSR